MVIRPMWCHHTGFGIALFIGGEDHRPVVRQVPAGPLGGWAVGVQREGRGHVLQDESPYERRAVLGEQAGDGAAQ
ncbi:hypothetical protein GCM10010104_32770 [Streptomyces indiaensis]|uniref:Uncharacterized protein n=1 Tax=Streptomyces indiaensis TaxID=284033 RepID=A0ABN3DLA8_9ACTN